MFETIVLAALLYQTAGASTVVLQPEARGLEGDWVVEIIDNIKVMPESTVTITFRGGRLSGLASCNTYSGPYRVAGSEITTESILTTMKACDAPRMSQERDFLSILRGVVRFELDGKTRIVLTDARGKSITATRK
jgi:heat shock protein HslJ